MGVRIPDNFRGQGSVTFGRAAKPGEQYESFAVSALAPGEAMHGMTIQGKTVAQVVAALSQRHLTALFQARPLAPTTVAPPGDMLVVSALPWAPGQVLLEFAPSTSSSASPSPAASR